MSKSKSKKKKTNKSPVNHQSLKVETVSVQTAYSGPIPPAQELGNYNAIVPGAAERILRMAEKNLQHQIDIEALDLNSARRGQIFAFLIAVLAFSSSIAAMIMGFPYVAGAIGSTTVVSLATVFIKGRGHNST